MSSKEQKIIEFFDKSRIDRRRLRVVKPEVRLPVLERGSAR